MRSHRLVDGPIEAKPQELKQLERLAELLRSPGAFSVLSGTHRSALTASALAALRAAVAVLLRGGATSIVPIEKELTTQQAAALLSVSRQYVVRLIDAGALKAAATEGGHRRVRLEDLLQYRRERERHRGAALDEVESLTAEYGGYARLKK